MGFPLEGKILWYDSFSDICACLEEITAQTEDSLWKEALVPRPRELSQWEMLKNK